VLMSVCPLDNRMATRELANRRINRVRGAENTRVSAGKSSPGNPVALVQHSNLRACRTRLRNFFTAARHTGTEHDGVNRHTRTERYGVNSVAIV
jgi:hypothetical protein